MNRTNRALLAAIFCCFSVCTLCATVLLSRYLPQTDASSVEVELPSLVGTTYAEDDERLPPSLYEVVFDYRSDASCAPGTVLSQQPAAASVRRVIPDRSRCLVRVTLSTGAAEFTVPPLIGKSARESAVLLRSHGLIVRTQAVTRNDLSPGQVVTVEPAEGTVMREGEIITLTESTVTTKRTLRVPSVVGSDVAAANSALVLRGLRPTEPTYVPSAEPRGTVISQQPLGGTLVPAGTRASLTVSDGTLFAEYEDEFEYESELEYQNEREEASGDE